MTTKKPAKKPAKKAIKASVKKKKVTKPSLNDILLQWDGNPVEDPRSLYSVGCDMENVVSKLHEALHLFDAASEDLDLSSDRSTTLLFIAERQVKEAKKDLELLVDELFEINRKSLAK